MTEELTVKDPAASRIRRPDVLAAWPDGRRVAFEVEYKAYTPTDWRAKQHDFEQMSPPVVAVWLFGHLHRYLVQAPRPPRLPEEQPPSTWPSRYSATNDASPRSAPDVIPVSLPNAVLASHVWERRNSCSWPRRAA